MDVTWAKEVRVAAGAGSGGRMEDSFPSADPTLSALNSLAILLLSPSAEGTDKLSAGPERRSCKIVSSTLENGQQFILPKMSGS